MNNFKVGDLVRIKLDADNSGFLEPVDELGTIQKISEITANLYGRTMYCMDTGSRWFVDDIEPVTKSLEELEVGDKVNNDSFTREVTEVKTVRQYKLKVIRQPMGISGIDENETWTTERLMEWGYTLYTPKKITVFKHKGKRYPVSEIIKNVKPL